ncbi:SusC/RagA family TonB-linked outer membrane protein [Maribacter litoralis]|uniref:SusC/RagA family TonB-linked outer membrane protein n=1 Tax=Maribacter litoralis TaxID=2059726 RepID=UPI003F5CF84D
MNKKPISIRGIAFYMTTLLFLSLAIAQQLRAGVPNPTKVTLYTSLLQSTISGTITDSNGQPLAGVTILVEQKNTGSISELDGTYNIDAEPNDILTFSAIGFKTETVPVDGRQVIDLTLQEDITQLDEVTLNAGYYTVTEKERTGNIATIKADVIDKQPVGNPLAAMQGHMSGVNIVQNTGVPGGGFSIEVRGRNFINGATEPLYIVDGVPFGSQSLGSNEVSSGIVAGNVSPLNAIDPNSIESIEVLKDADATAIYGSRGANGVVLITTKRGRSGETRFSADVSSSLGHVPHFLDLMDTQQYLEVRREGIANDGYSERLENPFFDFFWPDLKTWDQNRYTDWQKELIGGTAYRNKAQLSVSGGSELTNFLISAGHQKESTVFPGDNTYNKTTVHNTLGHRSKNDRFKIDLSTIYSREKNQLPRRDLTGSAYSLEPNAPALYDEEGRLNWENNTWNNPLASLEEEYVSNVQTLMANAIVSYTVLPDLELKTSLGFNSYQLDSYKTLPSSSRNPSLGFTPESYSSITTNTSKRESWIIEPQLHWKKSFGAAKLDLLVGTTFQQETTEQFVQVGRGFPNDQLLFNLSAAENLDVLEDSDSAYNYNAIFGRFNLSVMDRYILNLTGRRDGSSRFGPGRQFGNFGAVGLAWLFSEEALFAESSILSFGKLRASFGTTGSDNIGDYRFLDTYSISGKDYDGTPTLAPTGIFNPLFGWESNRKLEAALELGLFKDRIMINTSWYRNRSSNQLIGIPLAATTGFSELTGNFDATVENSGIELDIRSAIVRSKNLRWSTNFNFTVPRNKLVEFDGLETSSFSNQYIIGEPLTIVKLYKALGVDPQTGVYTFEDYDGDGNLTSLGDRKYVEDRAPRFYGGIGNTIGYGNLTFDFFFQFKKQKAFDQLAFGATPGYRGNQPVALLDRWREEGDETPIQKASGGYSPNIDMGIFQQLSNAAFTDASFVRLRNVSINYDVGTLGNGLGVNVYLQGQNLWTWTKYAGPDPEQPSNSRLPQLRQITLGLQLDF